MVELRPFRNTDPPHLAEIWRSQGPKPGLLQPLFVSQFEQAVLGKPYFDRAGLILALEGQRRLGFVHAGFGANEALSALETDLGVICLLMVRPEVDFVSVAGPLLSAAEEYLRRRGARVLYGGPIAPLNPFYFGLYGGSELPGVLDTDVPLQTLLKARGYQPASHVTILQRHLADFRPSVQRRQLALARIAMIQEQMDAPSDTWWEANVLSGIEVFRYRAIRTADKQVLAQAVVRDLGTVAGLQGVRAAGLVRLDVLESERRQGWATFLLGEALMRLRNNAFTLAEVQTMAYNTPALGLYEKLGFHRSGSGTVFRLGE